MAWAPALAGGQRSFICHAMTNEEAAVTDRGLEGTRIKVLQPFRTENCGVWSPHEAFMTRLLSRMGPSNELLRHSRVCGRLADALQRICAQARL